MFKALRGRNGLLCAGLAGIGALGINTVLDWDVFPKTLAEQAPSEAAPSALNSNEWRSFRVMSKEPVTKNTQRLRFALPDGEQVVGLPVASCLLTRAPIGSENPDGTRKFVIRPYTPTSLPDARGYLDLVVKGYEQGKLSKHIVGLKEGDTLDFKGPVMKLTYEPNMKKAIGMVAGGSGLTPMLQIASEILRNPEDNTEVSLIFGNQTEDDIILKPELDNMARKHKSFKVYYVVDKSSSWGWRGGVGYVTPQMVKDHLPPPSPDTLILVCGPPPMMNAISGDKAKDKSQGELSGILKQLGYSADQVFKF